MALEKELKLITTDKCNNKKLKIKISSLWRKNRREISKGY
jgi:hypothetical protein